MPIGTVVTSVIGIAIATVSPGAASATQLLATLLTARVEPVVKPVPLSVIVSATCPIVSGAFAALVVALGSRPTGRRSIPRAGASIDTRSLSLTSKMCAAPLKAVAAWWLVALRLAPQTHSGCFASIFLIASNFGSHIERVEASGTYADALYAFDCAFVCESCPRPRRGAPVTS